jgi:nucleoside-diphosphate-sugar epimerase
MRKRVLICGCGYVGQGVGASLAAQGHVVFGVRRSVESNASLLATGITPLNGDLVNPADVAALPGPFDWVINVVSSAHGGEAAYRSAYLESTRNLVRVFARSPCRFVYTGSTSVYAQTDGEWVAEDSTTSPATVTGLILRQTEMELLAAASPDFHPTVLRVAGIYGPERHHLLTRLLQGKRSGGNAARWLNMVHRDDVIGALQRVLESDAGGEVFNLADNEPVRAGEFERWLANRLNLDLSTLRPEEAGGAKRGASNKRVSNGRLREHLGWIPQYPTYRDGYENVLAMLP